MEMQAVFNYINSRRYREALNLLDRMPNRTAMWYYASGAANAGIGNLVVAREHAAQAVNMEQANVAVPSRYVALYQYKQRIQTILPQLKIYREVADSPVFLNECRSFLDSIYFWNIPQSELPQESEAQKELFAILSQLTDIAVPSKQQRAALTNIKTKDRKSVV